MTRYRSITIFAALALFGLTSLAAQDLSLNTSATIVSPQDAEAKLFKWIRSLDTSPDIQFIDKQADPVAGESHQTAHFQVHYAGLLLGVGAYGYQFVLQFDAVATQATLRATLDRASLRGLADDTKIRTQITKVLTLVSQAVGVQP